MEFYEYFLSYEDYFWQWEDDREVLAIPGGNTVAYKDFVLDIFRKIHLQGVPPFGSLLLAIIATNPSGKNDIDGIFSMMRAKAPDGASSQSLNNAVSFLHMLTELPAAYKQGSRRVLLMQAIFENCHNIASPKNSLEIYNSYLTTAYLTGNVAVKKPFSKSNFQKDFKTLEILGNRFRSIQDILEKIASLPEIHEPVVLPYSEPQKTEEPADLIDQLIENEKTFHTGSLVKRIRSGLNIPMHSALPSEQPVGGVSDLTNKGDFDKLLISEFANDDIVFLSRLANNEALYIRREVPPVNNNLERIFLIDSSLRNWGTPKNISFAIMLAIAKHPKTDIASATFVLGKSFHPVSVENIHTIIDGMQLLEGAADASEGLRAFFKEFPANKSREVFFISESSNFKKPQMMKALVDHHAGIHYWIQTDAEGGIDIYKKQQQSKRHVQRLLLPLEELWKKKPNMRHAGKTSDNNIHSANYPILFPYVKRFKKNILQINGEIFLITRQKKIFRFFDKDAKPYDKGWQLLYENLPFTSHELGLGITEEGEFILLMYHTQSKEFTLLDLSSMESKTGNFENWRGEINKGFLFFERKFHHANSNGSWTIDLDGNVEEKGASYPAIIKNQKEQLELSKKFSYSMSVFKNITSVSISNEGKLLFNSHELYHADEYKTEKAVFILNRAAAKRITSKRSGKDKFEFADGSTAEVNISGIIILRSSNAGIPEIYIASTVDSAAAFATSTSFAGNSYYYRARRSGLIIADKGANTLLVIKVLKEAINTGLKEAGDYVNGMQGKVIYTDTNEKVTTLRKALMDAGAKVIVQHEDEGLVKENSARTPAYFYSAFIQPFINHIQAHSGYDHSN